jgi:hypothetical protein
MAPGSSSYPCTGAQSRESTPEHQSTSRDVQPQPDHPHSTSSCRAAAGLHWKHHGLRCPAPPQLLLEVMPTSKRHGVCPCVTSRPFSPMNHASPERPCPTAMTLMIRASPQRPCPTAIPHHVVDGVCILFRTTPNRQHAHPTDNMHTQPTTCTPNLRRHNLALLRIVLISADDPCIPQTTMPNSHYANDPCIARKTMSRGSFHTMS